MKEICTVVGIIILVVNSGTAQVEDKVQDAACPIISVRCARKSCDASPFHQTIIGGTGTGAYANANGSINNNNPHNPFLVGTNIFTLVVPGVTANSTFSNVVIQFGTAATPPNGTTPVPEPASMLLLGTGLIGVAGAARRKLKARR